MLVWGRARSWASLGLSILTCVFAGCGGSADDDELLVESVTITPESLADAGFALTDDEARDAFLGACELDSGTCSCAVDGVFSQVSGPEFSFLSIAGPEGPDIAAELAGSALMACQRAQPVPSATPSKVDSFLGDPVEVTPAVMDDLNLISEEQGKASFVESCSELGDETTCECSYDELRQQLSLEEITVLALHGLEVVVGSSFVENATDSCSAD